MTTEPVSQASGASANAAGLRPAGDVAVEAENARRLAAVAPLVRAMTSARWRGPAAEDAAQSVLEGVWRAQQRGVFADEEGVRRYAATLARVVPPSDDRHSVRAAAVGELGEHLWADATPGPAEQAERLEAVARAREHVAALLERLSPREREVIAATHLGGRPTSEVAADLGVTPSGVRSAQTRAMARMRESQQAESPNPLASGISERERQRDAWGRLAAAVPDGPQGRRALEAAHEFAAEQGRLPSRSELAARCGVGSGTAQRVVRALRDRDVEDDAGMPDVEEGSPRQAGAHGTGVARGAQHEDDVPREVDLVSAPSVAESSPAVSSWTPVHRAVPGTVAGDRPPGGRDPLDDARAAVGRAQDRADDVAAGDTASAVAPDEERRAQLVLWGREDLHRTGPQDGTGDVDADAAPCSGGSR